MSQNSHRTGIPFIVGLTGGIASGKTTVADCFADLGAPVIDADAVAREVVLPGQPALDQLVEAFGEGILAADEQLDRSRLREVVFDNPGKRKQLESILHPAIGAMMQERMAAARGDYIIQMVPLLVETGGHQRVDRVLVIDTPEEVQVARVTARDGVDAAQARAILEAQADREKRLAHAHDVILNDGDPAHIHAWVKQLDRAYREMAHDPAARTRHYRFP